MVACIFIEAVAGDEVSSTYEQMWHDSFEVLRAFSKLALVGSHWCSIAQ